MRMRSNMKVATDSIAVQFKVMGCTVITAGSHAVFFERVAQETIGLKIEREARVFCLEKRSHSDDS
jgi:hypothetical protein